MERTIDVVSMMQFIHIWYTKHEDNEKNESEEFSLEYLPSCRSRVRF